MSYKMITCLFAVMTALTPVAGFSDGTDLQSQISSLDTQIAELNKARNQEAMNAYMVRKNADSQDSQDSQNAMQQEELYMNKARAIDDKIAVLEEQKAALKSQLAASKTNADKAGS